MAGVMGFYILELQYTRDPELHLYTLDMSGTQHTG